MWLSGIWKMTRQVVMLWEGEGGGGPKLPGLFCQNAIHSIVLDTKHLELKTLSQVFLKKMFLPGSLQVFLLL